ncbi:glycosyltransferase family 2 protein [Bradyrhizobium sp. AUGA SZCCT0177]|uniref:glycosyltransferase family 2 protein n=1 Tax=unclassified Bradyrhizobium TaxID=2631580 RepID=UPI001BAB8355|nr:MULTISPECIES: glycosyltransferase family 2 protein [unclassified Bradyrhizobium]MBR1234591.1 glycosyltransferase family 2 protein [Bradyrhizobium sp. AUGA SZCCT0182]MBR1285803.1 glycosyltransferase family 2 protein [Bradyrhizobium sp. AUGA SZCCT0177]
MQISVVVPAHNEQENLPVLLDQILNAIPTGLHEIIVVDDGSTDDSLALVKAASHSDQRIKYIGFSRNFGHQTALRAGLRAATGDCVITMDADLQHPPRLLPDLVSKWREGFKIVLTIRKDVENLSGFKRLTSSLFYKLMNSVSDVSIDPGSADFRLLDRKVVDVINNLSEHDFFLRGIIPWVGFPVTKIDYTPDQRLYGSTKYSLRKMISFAITGVIANSVQPLRLATILALIIASLSALYAMYAMMIFLTYGRVVPGWTSVALVVSVIGALQLFVLGVVGEYVGRILRETRNRPGYVISQSNIDRAGE